MVSPDAFHSQESLTNPDLSRRLAKLKARRPANGPLQMLAASAIDPEVLILAGFDFQPPHRIYPQDDGALGCGFATDGHVSHSKTLRGPKQ
jgi:hypothetical protein